MIDEKVVTAKDYPFQFEVYLIYRKDNQNENIPQMVSYLKTEEGKRLIELAK